MAHALDRMTSNRVICSEHRYNYRPHPLVLLCPRIWCRPCLPLYRAADLYRNRTPAYVPSSQCRLRARPGRALVVCPSLSVTIDEQML